MFGYILLFLGTFNSGLDCQINQIRSAFFTLETNEEAITSFIAQCEESSCKEASFYHAVAVMRMAEYAYWPNQKYKYFTQGRDQLESLVKQNPQNLELRFLRYLVQTEVPAFLGYTENRAEDLKFVKDNINQSNYPDELKENISITLNYLNK